MADVELGNSPQSGDGFRRSIVQAMAGMDFEPKLGCKPCALDNTLPFRLCCRGALCGPRVAPGAGMNFNNRSPQPRSRFDLLRIGSDEKRDADSGLVELRHRR